MVVVVDVVVVLVVVVVVVGVDCVVVCVISEVVDDVVSITPGPLHPKAVVNIIAAQIRRISLFNIAIPLFNIKKPQAFVILVETACIVNL